MTDPFLLLTLSGSALGIALILTLRRPKRNSHPLRARRQRAVGIPAALTVALGGVGGALLIDASLVVNWWRWAVALSAAALLYTGMVLLSRGWARAVVALVIVVPIVPAWDAWTSLPHGADYLKLGCEAPTLVVRANERPRDDDPPVVLLRIDPPLGDDDRMVVRVLPAVDLALDAAGGPDAANESATTGAWLRVGTASATDTVRMVVTVERYAPPLWWFPTSEWISKISLSTGEHRTTLVAPPARITNLTDGRDSRTVEAELPARSAHYLQSGVYTLEYSCGPTDTGNV
ncbi:MAG: hypothetical protein ACOCYB_02240 [Alkalispirochaeta sp.]